MYTQTIHIFILYCFEINRNHINIYIYENKNKNKNKNAHIIIFVYTRKFEIKRTFIEFMPALRKNIFQAPLRLKNIK